MDFDRAMTELAQHLDSGAAEQALAAARALKEALLQASVTDPVQLGWARDYELRALHRLGRWSEGLALLQRAEERPYAHSPKNAAWLCSVGAEMAMRSGEAEQVPELSSRAAALRVADGDPRGAVLAARTGFTLCSMAGRPELAERLAERIEGLWRAEKPGSARAMAAYALLEQVSEAAWGTPSLPSRERRALELLLHDAAAAGDADAVRRCLFEGAGVDALHPKRSGLPTPLIAAAFRGWAEVVRALLQAGASVDFLNVQGRSALHLAADQGHAEVVGLLCAAGASLDGQDLNGQTALHLAAWQDHLDAVAVLLAAGADAEVQDDQGMTALCLAATEPVPRVVEALARAGANVDASTPHGQTPLMFAAMHGQTDVARALLLAGASRPRRDVHGLRAAEWARREGHGELASLVAA